MSEDFIDLLGGWIGLAILYSPALILWFGG